jgi:hypothetical protein
VPQAATPSSRAAMSGPDPRDLTLRYTGKF